MRGSRRIEVRWFGRGNTAGDLVVHLPEEGIVATGDLVVHPVPFAFGSYPSEWIGALDSVTALEPRILVPGHGPVMRDTDYLHAVRQLLEAAREGPAALDRVRARVIGDEKWANTMFHRFFRVPVMQRLIDERAGSELRPDTTTSDTLRLEVGSPLVDGRVYAPHAARVRVRVGDATSPLTAEWTNELTLGDSAGRPVMRWVTNGTRYSGTASGAPVTWELRQTYDARTLAPYQYHQTSSTGGLTRLTIEGRRVRGTRRLPGDSVDQPVDLTLDRPGFFAGASDLVPLAVGLRAGVVMTAPVWSPAMVQSELRIFTVVDQVAVDVEGTMVEAWKVEERFADGRLHATWYLVERSPYMVYGEVVLPDGRIQRMTEVEVPTSHD